MDSVVLEAFHQLGAVYRVVCGCQIDENHYAGLVCHKALLGENSHRRDVFADLCSRPEPYLPVSNAGEQHRFQPLQEYLLKHSQNDILECDGPVTCWGFGVFPGFPEHDRAVSQMSRGMFAEGSSHHIWNLAKSHSKVPVQDFFTFLL